MEFTEADRRKAIIAGEERLVLAMQAFRLVFPDRVVVLAESCCESARSIRHVRLDSPMVDPESPSFKYFSRQSVLTTAVRLLVAPSLRDRLAVSRLIAMNRWSQHSA